VETPPGEREREREREGEGEQPAVRAKGVTDRCRGDDVALPTEAAVAATSPATE